MNELYLLDGYALVYRSYFAFIRNPLINQQGRNVSATFGFFRSLISLFEQYKPAYFAVAMDSRVPTFRHEQYREYKATREKTPDELHEQVPTIEEILGALGVPVIRVDGFEADDVMATLAERCRSEKRPCYIISGDKDLLQLVAGPVKVLRPEKGGYEVIGPAEVARDWGVRPDQILDYLALIGDASDNVPGVRGIGPKSAAKLLQDFDTLDGVYGNLERAPKSQAAKLAEDRENAYMSRGLITLRTDVPLPESAATLEALHVGSLDLVAAAPLFQREGLRGLATQAAVGAQAGTAGAAGAPAGPGTAATRKGRGGRGAGKKAGSRGADSAEGGAGEGEAAEELSAASAAAAAGTAAGGAKVSGGAKAAEELRRSQAFAEPKRGRYVTVTDLAELDRWISRARTAKRFAFDSETDSLDATLAHPVGFSLAVKAGEACYIPLKAAGTACLPEDQVRERLRSLFSDPSVQIIGQNIKYDLKVLGRWGAGFRPWFDTMIAAWLIDSSRATYNMDDLAEWYLDYKTIHFGDVVPKGETFDAVPAEAATQYAAEDADVTLRLYEKFEPLLREHDLARLFFDVEMPLVPVLAEMELAGIRVLPLVLNRFGTKLGKELGELERKIYAASGREFNLNSTRQLQEVLFHDLALTPTKKTQTGFSTDTAVLEELALEEGAAGEVPRLLLRYRLLSKLKSTYVDTLPTLINPETGRIHTSFVQTGTATGRIASRDPNLQNIPIRDEEGRQIRSAFVPEAGKVFVSADYAQIELVVLAHLSGDPALRAAFTAGSDVHSQTGSLIFGIPEGEVSTDQRRIAKTINFGVMYGMSAFRLARELSIPRNVASQFIEAYFQKYSGIRKFIDETTEKTKESGYVKTLLGRRRPVPGIASRNRTEQMAAQRIAVNTPIQGSAADIVKLAMLAVAARMKKEKLKSRMILQVHDELIFEAPEIEVTQLMALLKEEMESAVKLDVPLRVSVESGGSWGDLH